MKVKDLITALSDQDPDGEVYFSHDSHDYWGSVLASTVSEVEESEIRYSDYHNAYSVPKGEDCDGDDEDKRKVVILLS